LTRQEALDVIGGGLASLSLWVGAVVSPRLVCWLVQAGGVEYN
jgi:hypothetical protein